MKHKEFFKAFFKQYSESNEIVRINSLLQLIDTLSTFNNTDEMNIDDLSTYVSDVLIDNPIYETFYKEIGFIRRINRVEGNIMDLSRGKEFSLLIHNNTVMANNELVLQIVKDIEYSDKNTLNN